MVSFAFANKKLDISSVKADVSYASSIKYLVDTSGQLSILQVSSEAYNADFKHYSKNFNIQNNQALWGRLTITNSDSKSVTSVVMISDWIGGDIVNIYLQKDDEQDFDVLKTGYLRSIKEKTISEDCSRSYFKLKLNSKETKQVYFRLQNLTGFQPRIILSFESKDNFKARVQNRDLLQGLFQGVLLLLIAFSIIAYYFVKEKSLLFYSLHIFLIGLFFLNFHGFFQSHLFTESPFISHFFWIIALGGGTVAYIHFLVGITIPKSDNNWIKWVKTYSLIKIALLIGTLIGIILDFSLYSYGINIFLALTPFEFLIVVIYIIASVSVKNKANLFFIIGAFLLYAGTTATYLKYELSSRLYADSTFIQIGVCLEIILFSIGIAYRFNQLEKKRVFENENLITRLREEEEAQVRINEGLERKVKERTKTLESQQLKIVEQNNELKKQQKELETQKNQLALQNQIIEQQNSQLLLTSENLESLVKSRTEELSKANRALIRHIHQLQDFAYITAHNLRGPIASLMGLINIFNKNDLNDSFNQKVLEEIEVSTLKLNDVVKDLNEILQIKKGNNLKIENISIEEIVKLVLRDLYYQVKQYNVKVDISIKDAKWINGIRSYVNSIFAIIIENAIKYRSKKRSLEIKVESTFFTSNEILVTIEDNGMGIDLSKYRDKIFGLYQRFHIHVEGKGMGLYLAKTQIEALGGRIDIESDVEKGTTFYLYFPF